MCLWHTLCTRLFRIPYGSTTVRRVHRSRGLDRSIEVPLVVPAVLRNLVPMQGLNPDD